MFDLGWPELFVIVLVALVVLGPKELPGAIRTVTGLIRRARGLAREFHKSLDDMAKESGLDEVKRDIQKATRAELLDDDDAFKDPFAEADRNSILNPTNGSKLPKPKANGTATKEAAAEPTDPEPKPVASTEASVPEPTPAPHEPAPTTDVAKESGRA